MIMGKTIKKANKQLIVESTKGSETKRLRKYQNRVFGINEFLMGYTPSPRRELSGYQPAANNEPRGVNFSRLVRVAARFRNQPVVSAASSSFLKGAAWRDFLRVRSGIARFKRKIKAERRRILFRVREASPVQSTSVKARISRVFKADAAVRQEW